MKKYIITTIAILLGLMGADAQTVSVPNVDLKPGETKVVSILLENTQTDIVAFQMDLTLPEGITINKAGCSLGSRITDMTQELTIGKQDNQTIRLTSASFSLTPISGTSGEIVKLSLSAALDAKGGTAQLNNIILATSNSQKLTPSAVSFNVNVFYTLIYKVDGEVYKTSSVVYGTTLVPEENPTKEGYTFSGWSDIPAVMPIHDVEVTGSFAINSYTLTYMLDGKEYKKGTVVFGTPLTLEAEPSKEGHTFSGWSEIPSTMPASDVTVTGSFIVNKYTLTYIVDDQTYKTFEIEYGTTITPAADPEREGYLFSGWSLIPSTMPADNVTVTGSFTKGQYKLVYMVDGDNYKTISIDFGTIITPETEPTKEGYTFGGWSEIPATMPAHDVNVTGTFAINSYQLTYVLDGEVYQCQTLNYGATITPLEALVKEGYSFSGWSEIPSTMPAHDVTVTASFTKCQYQLTYMVNNQVFKVFSYYFEDSITPEPAITKEGHTFSGWSEIPATMPSHDVTVTGTLTVNRYQLVYMVDGEVYQTYSVDYGTTLEPIAAPTKEGHTFSGWSWMPGKMPAEDVVVKGTFSPNSYQLTYMVDGNTYQTTTIEYGKAIVTITAPTKEGHTFSGWSEYPSTMPAHDVTITGSFTINSYQLTYLVDGVSYQSTTIVFGSFITPISEPTKEGYTFSGWSQIPETMPEHDVVITGTFLINSYQLTYMVDGEVYQTMTLEYGTTITTLIAPTKEGYIFSGWSEIPLTMPATDVTVTGSFSKGQYTLTYMVDGQTYKTIRFDYGDDIVPEAEPTREGYTFSGWTEIPATMPNIDVVVTGTFTINSYVLSYTVDGVEYKTMTIEYGADITPEDNPTKEGYTFSGWSMIPSTMPAKNVVVTGTFSINSYQLIYMVDGTTYQRVTVVFGSDIIPIGEPSKEGYTFSGWSEIPATMPAKDVEVTGSFTVNKYTLSYTVDGETYKTYEVEYGASITPEAEPSKEGYTFSGWSLVPSTMPAKDVIVTGSFTVNKYTLSYTVDGETYRTYEVEYGTSINSETEPTKEGYTFSGWSLVPPTMPAQNVTVSGSFTVNKYVIRYYVGETLYAEDEVEYGSPVVLHDYQVEDATRYAFSGWDGEMYDTMPAHDIEYHATIIDGISMPIPDDGMYQIFSLDGRPYKTLQKGVNLIRFSNGQVKKVLVK